MINLNVGTLELCTSIATPTAQRQKCNVRTWLSWLSDLFVQLLGVTVQNNLSWSKHYDNVCSSAYRSLGLQHKCEGEIYLFLLQSKLSYCMLSAVEAKGWWRTSDSAAAPADDVVWDAWFSLPGEVFTGSRGWDGDLLPCSNHDTVH